MPHTNAIKTHLLFLAVVFVILIVLTIGFLRNISCSHQDAAYTIIVTKTDYKCRNRNHHQYNRKGYYKCYDNTCSYAKTQYWGNKVDYFAPNITRLITDNDTIWFTGPVIVKKWK